MKNLHTAAYNCLTEQNLEQKLLLAKKLNDDLLEGNLTISAVDLPAVEQAGRPEKPQLVHPREVPKR
jgi:uncharacterized ferritin-like protein (DUF455 family)